MAGVKNFWFDVALFVLASPMLLVFAARRGVHRYRFFRLAMRTAIVCECGSIISLVGLWRCACGWTYRGHLLRTCPVCDSIACVVRCHRCGVTTKLPEAS
jgi:hypothetical protein